MELKSENSSSINVYVHPRLKDVLAAIQKEMALHIKEKFKLETITISGTVASETLAARYLGDKSLKFKIKKTGLNEGILEFE